MPKTDWKSRFYHETPPIQIGDCTLVYSIDATHATVQVGQRRLRLTVAEALIFEKLGSVEGVTVPHQQALPEAKSRNIRHLVDVHLSKLRASLQAVGSEIEIHREPGGARLEDTRK